MNDDDVMLLIVIVVVNEEADDFDFGCRSSRFLLGTEFSQPREPFRSRKIGGPEERGRGRGCPEPKPPSFDRYHHQLHLH